MQTLESLVDEFSQFARFPAAKLAPADLNSMVESALELFRGRLDGVTRANGTGGLAAAGEGRPGTDAAGDGQPDRQRRRSHGGLDDPAAATWPRDAESDGDAVEIEVSDSGHGISPEDKLKLFLPHFSTKERGTGLGLAIASRIIAEHNGTIRVEDNLPDGRAIRDSLPRGRSCRHSQTAEARQLRMKSGE